ncbi:nuclear transport factor 2 family protein [Chryseobacterium sp. Chry.R1]|uniref:nuclear transport factor 2 family protein n=1 Tax=Chryseobacterium sp. Chry.R1 TaxID=3139392 RepID=UPI0031F9824E
MRKYILTLFILIFTLATIPGQNTETLMKEGVKSDSMFWVAYNKCNVSEMMRFIPADVEFYHDKGGITKGDEALKITFQKNLCGNKDFHLRREAIDKTVRVFPMKKDDKLYGLIISGDHYFYINETGKKEFRDGLAKFTDLWILENGKWKMSRVLSYDHGPAPYQNERKEIPLKDQIMKIYQGNYNSRKNGIISVEPKNSILNLTVGGKTLLLYPETENRFFTKEKDLVFEFVKEKNKIIKMNVYENGNLIEEDYFTK